MKPKKYFITGISTDVGKTITSAIMVEALEADYWKPVQAGDLHYSDIHKVQKLISNSQSVFYDNSYALQTPMSPHESARLDGVTIDLAKIKEPETNNHLVIEGAGGLLVPLNATKTILDIIKLEYKVIVVSRHYLGSINHTLLTIQLLQQKGFEVLLVYSGDEHKSTESIIEKMTRVEVLGRIENEPYFDKNVIKEYAEKFKTQL
ncbi:MAG: dethiobiotin synthase [Flavobacteriaceae bacterium]|nr:dethiobiotin synthase [Flavobacteriaceae bacterium]